VKYPPLASLASKAHPTLVHVMKNGPHSVHGLDFKSMPTVEGDNRVSFTGTIPPEGTTFEQFLTQNGHGSLLDDPIAVEILTKLHNKHKEQ
jgi:hypothetical protein